MTKIYTGKHTGKEYAELTVRDLAEIFNSTIKRAIKEEIKFILRAWKDCEVLDVRECAELPEAIKSL